MSAGGDGIVDTQPLVEVARPALENAQFIPRRFRVGGRLGIADAQGIQSTHLITCVLCGGLLLDAETNDEHPLPQWLHRFAGDSGERKADAFTTSKNIQPTWRQLCLASHKECNSQFARKIENPAISALKAAVNGGRLTWTQLDALFDWLDKIKSASAHMGAALRGHSLRLGYNEVSFPNRRVGAFDRTAAFFRISEAGSPLDLWECLNDGFLTTPSAIVLRVRDLIIVFASNNYLLSKAFGLGTGAMIHGEPAYTAGLGDFSAGFGSRFTRLPIAKILAQPMRRQHQKEFGVEQNHALQEDGAGKLFELNAGRWVRVASTDFSDLRRLPQPLGYSLAGLEAVEWIILSKEQDFSRYGFLGGAFMQSLPGLIREKRELLDMIASVRAGLRPEESDRPRMEG